MTKRSLGPQWQKWKWPNTFNSKAWSSTLCEGGQKVRTTPLILTDIVNGDEALQLLPSKGEE
jgi:hypothetical protein